MTPRLLLSLWRGRWGKVDGAAHQVPYLQGKIYRWMGLLVQARAWSRPTITLTVCLASLLGFILIASVRHALASQLVFSGFLLACGLFLRRYSGRAFTVTLMALSAIASTRYLDWRFSATSSLNIDWACALGLILCLAELYLCVWVGLGWINTLWPVRRDVAVLPDDSNAWPTADVLLLCQNMPHEAVGVTVATCAAWIWPRQKIKFYLLDGSFRDEVQALAKTLGAQYFVCQDGGSDRAIHINALLPQLDGDFTVLIEGDQAPAANFLQNTLACMLRNKRLAMLQTAHHFLAPAPAAQHLQLFGATSSDPRYAVFRRASLLASQGWLTEPVSAQPHMALKLQALGFSHAYIGPAGTVEHPYRPTLLRWRQAQLALQAMLQFYYPLPRFVFYTAPVVYLLADLDIIQANPALFAAYALPHFVHAQLASARLQGRGRYKVLTDMRETLFSWSILKATPWALWRTELTRFMLVLKGGKRNKSESFDWMVSLPFALVLALNVWGLISAGLGLGLSLAWSQHAQTTLLYMGWSACLLMLLSATLAVAEEARHIRQQSGRLAPIPAMLRLTSGRTISCQTENILSLVLELKIPQALAVPVGAEVDVSVFRDDQEFSFAAQVVSRLDQVLSVSIKPSAQKSYADLGQAMRTRGKDWPGWLPNKHADQLVPNWLQQIVQKLSMAILDVFTHRGRYLHRNRFITWMQQWKFKKL